MLYESAGDFPRTGPADFDGTGVGMSAWPLAFPFEERRRPPNVRNQPLKRGCVPIRFASKQGVQIVLFYWFGVVPSGAAPFGFQNIDRLRLGADSRGPAFCPTDRNIKTTAVEAPRRRTPLRIREKICNLCIAIGPRLEESGLLVRGAAGVRDQPCSASTLSEMTEQRNF